MSNLETVTPFAEIVQAVKEAGGMVMVQDPDAVSAMLTATTRPPDATPSAHDRVYRTLRTQIMHGEMEPGTALTLRGLGKQFGVSMTPAREAVRRLAAEG